MNEDKMNQLKEEYMNIQLPAEGLKQLEETISRAIRHKRRREKICLFRNVAAGMAAVFAGIIVMVNVNADFAYAMEQIPVLGSVIKVINFEHYQVRGGEYTADIRVPKLESEEELPGISKVNEAVKKDRDELIAQYRGIFESTECDVLRKEEGKTGHYNIDADYEIVTDNEAYFVLHFWSVVTSASAQQVERYYTIDKSTGEMLELKDLFKKDSDYITVISDCIKEQMKQQMSEDEDVCYWLESEVEEWNFKEIMEKQSFYINEHGNLVISFDEFEVAPGYMGSVSFEIPEEKIRSILK